MNDEIRLILRLVREGKLTEDQADAMIAAVRERTGAPEPPADSEPEEREENGARHRGRRHKRHRRRGGHREERYFTELGDQVAAVIDRSVRGATSALRHAGRLGPVAWVNESNVSILSKLEEPQGDNYICEDNQANVSQLRELVLDNATFSDNELNASALREVTVDHGEFRGNQMHGSSLKQVTLDNGHLTECEMNGARISGANIRNGTLVDCSFNGAHLRELNLRDATVQELSFNGANVKGFSVGGNATVKRFSFNGTKCRDFSIEGGEVERLRLSGLSVTSCCIRNSRLHDVVFKKGDWRTFADDDLVTPRLNELVLENATLEEVRFVRCRFDRTVFHDCDIRGLTFSGVDFTDMTIDSAEQLRALADDAVA